MRAQPWKAGGHNIVKQISSNLNVLVQGLRWESCSHVPFAACPTDRTGLSFAVPTHGMTNEMSAGGGGWSGWDLSLSPRIGRSCVFSAG